MISTIHLLLMLLLASAYVGGPSQITSQQSIPSDTLIALRRSGCFGICPVYQVTIAADGSVTFDGEEFVKSKGKAHGKINREQLLKLIAEFEQAKYFSLKDGYADHADGCPEVWTDYPSATTSVRLNGKSKTIVHYHGCLDGGQHSIYPKALTDLEQKIDDIAGTQRWIK